MINYDNMMLCALAWIQKNVGHPIHITDRQLAIAFHTKEELDAWVAEHKVERRRSGDGWKFQINTP